MFDSARYPCLARIHSPAELRAFEETQLSEVATELRHYLIESVGKSGGHFAAGLGVIELTVALHYIYDTPVDQLVWDVGHQSYPHKILTGRRDHIHTIKQAGGLAPFPKREESMFDAFGTGHSSTSISAILGMALACQQRGDERKLIAVIGDGAMTAGMAFEAMAHAGGIEPEPNLLVILNDNNMSISEAVGGLTRMLGRATTSHTLNALRESGKKILGDKRSSASARFIKRWEEQWKGMFVPSTAFEHLGFHYTGPIDGHDLPLLLSTLTSLKQRKGLHLLHLLTTKGKGYEPAENDQIGYHAVGPFDPSQGLPTVAAKEPTYTDVFSDWLCDAAAADERVMGITPAMREGSGLVRFSKCYPQRYFDVAIAEQHAVTLAAGMATQGAKPVVAIYSTFLQRAYDQLIHDVAIQNLDVLLAIDRAGVVGPDGATHAGNLDLSFLRCVPNLLIMAPADEAECRQMLSTGLAWPGPAAVRYPRGVGTGAAPGTDLQTLPIGQAQLRHQGQQLALLAFGACVPVAEEVGRKFGLSVLNMRFVKPLDKTRIVQLAQTHQGLVTLEDNVIAGGAGSAVAELLASEGIVVPILHLGLPDYFQPHASRQALLAQAGLDAQGVTSAIIQRWPHIQHRHKPPLDATQPVSV